MTTELDETRLRRLIEAGPRLISELELETVLDRLLETAREVTGASYAALGVLDKERRELERFLTRGLSDEQERKIGPRPRGLGILGLLNTSPRSIRLADLSRHPHSYGFPLGHPPMASFLGVPIIINDLSWGNLYLTNKATGEFDEADEQAVGLLAAWAAIAIEHTRLLEGSRTRQRELERALRGLEATQAIAVAVGAETDLPHVLELIAKRGRAIVGARSVVIMLAEEDDLVAVVAVGHSRPATRARIPIAASTSGEVMMSQRPVRIDATDQLLIPPAEFGVPDATTALLVPLIYRGRSLGVLVAFDRDEGLRFGEEDERLLVAFAASAATAVATAQVVQADRLRHSLEAAEEERKRWARELHDETLQTLGGLKLMASAARRGDAEQMAAALEALTEGLEGGIENLHAIITELRPAALDDLGLVPAIETLADYHRVTNGLEVLCRLELTDEAHRERRLMPEFEATIYRLVQEALTNVARHANATQVTIQVVAADGSIVVDVGDDGVGFDVAAFAPGFGLTGIRERVALAGGTVTIESGDGGTHVRARLPARYED